MVALQRFEHFVPGPVSRCSNLKRQPDLLDHLVRAKENALGDGNPNLLGSFEVDHEHDLVDSLYRQISWVCTSEHSLNMLRGDAADLGKIPAVGCQAPSSTALG